MKKAISLFLFLLSCLAHVGSCQVVNRSFINTSNGLPDNHIYCLLVDHNGYLWMGTTNGVVRDNGYKLKVYSHNEGLVNNDVWHISEDKKGRLWAFSISDQLGYIANEKYVRIYNPSGKTLYPQQILTGNDYVSFISYYVNETGMTLCIVADDTIRSRNFESGSFIHSTAMSGNYIFQTSQDTLVRGEYSLQDNKAPHLHFDTPGVFKNYIHDEGKNEHYVYKDRIMTFGYNNSFFSLLDVRRKEQKTYDLRQIGNNNDAILFSYELNNAIFIIGRNYLYFLDSNAHVITKYKVDSILFPQADGNQVCNIANDTLWGLCVGTTSNGAVINYPDQHKHFEKITKFQLTNYELLGCTSDTVSYWWDKNTSQLATVCLKQGRISFSAVKQQEKMMLQSILPYNSDSSVLFGFSKLYWHNNKKKSTLSEIVSLADEQCTGSAGAMISGDSIMIVSFLGVFIANTKHPAPVKIDNERYRDICVDNTRDLFWIYNNDRILLYNKRNNCRSVISSEMLNKVGITVIEKIITDHYGNIFIKTHDQLLVRNNSPLSNVTLFNNINLTAANVLLDKDRLIVSGTFGVAVINIEGAMRFSSPVLYENIKTINYDRVLDQCVLGDSLLLHTDRGDYRIALRRTDAHSKVATVENSIKVKFLLTYNDTIRRFEQGDTFNIMPGIPKLVFDVINPKGVGTLGFKYCIPELNTGWQDLNANELNLHGLHANRYHKLCVIAYDDVWRSKCMTMYIFTVPRWWQRPSITRLFIAAGILFLMLLVYAVALVTRRRVMNREEKKNTLLELELRSIYAQINPHFIFNTFNTILSFIQTRRMDDAYAQVTKFSKLLRAYIESTRSKQVTIASEINNVEHYIEIQQSRFEDKFVYDIITDERIDKSIVTVPAFLLQPIVENAIIHGLFHLKGNGYLRIEFRQGESDNQLICTVEDNGVGRDQSRLIREKNDNGISRKSYGTQLINELIAAYNKYEKVHIEMHYTDKESPETGTIVQLIITNQQHE